MAKAKSVNQSTAQSEQDKRTERAAKRVARFKEVAPRRVKNALRALEKLSQVANRGRYTYDDEQAQKIIAALTSRVEKIRDAFTASTAGKEDFVL